MARIDHIRQMLQKDPNDTFLLFALGMEHYAASQYDQAIACFDRVVEVAPDHDAAYMQKGRALVELGRHGEAKKALAGGMAAAQKKNDQHAYDKMREFYEIIKTE